MDMGNVFTIPVPWMVWDVFLGPFDGFGLERIEKGFSRGRKAVGV